MKSKEQKCSKCSHMFYDDRSPYMCRNKEMIERNGRPNYCEDYNTKNKCEFYKTKWILERLMS